MTEAYTTRMVNCAPTTSFVECRKALRSAIISARPILPDDQSRRTKLLAAKKIWGESKPAIGSIAEIYLHNHGVEFDPNILKYIRFNQAVLHEPTRDYLPAMLAQVHNLDGDFMGIHKTYLASDGSGRAKVREGVTRMLGTCHGSHVQLSNINGFKLIVTESMEAALAIQQACPDFPVWSAMTPGNMRAAVPSTIKQLTLCADSSSQNNEKLLMEAVRDHMGRGVTVLVARRPPGTSFGDMLRMG